MSDGDAKKARREGLLLRGLVVAVVLALAWLALPRVRRLFGKGTPPPKLVALAESESPVLPRRTYPKAEVAALRVSHEAVDVAGKPRTYVLVAPSSPEPGRAYPVVLVLHGDGGSSESFHRGFPFEEASGDRAVLAYPDAPAGWDLETTTDNRDVAFLTSLVDALAVRFTIDRSRVFAAGYSRGGFFANVMACQKSGFFRAISSSAGGAPYHQAESFPNGYPKCPGQAPTATVALHGTLDFGVTLDSGKFSAAYWAYVNGCETTQIEPTGYDECTAYRRCPAGKAVAFCEVGGLGHWVWNRAAEASWTFFLGQSGATDERALR